MLKTIYINLFLLYRGFCELIKRKIFKKMNIQQPLTKENFWNSMMELYPLATKRFCDWIDDYKKAVNWDDLFNPFYKKKDNSDHWTYPKFHDLPYAIQQGIWIEFANYILNEYFEQPEYTYEFDLEENIKTVLSELEKAETEANQI